MMKRIIWVALLIPVALNAQNKSEIEFITDMSLKDVKAKAKKEGKYLFVDAFTTWCGPCKKMDRDIYSDSTVASFYNKNFVCYKAQLDSTENDLDVIKSRYGDAHFLMTNYNINTFPTYLFFAPDGMLVHRDLGLKAVQAFITLGKNAMNSNTQLYSQVAAWRLGKLRAYELYSLYNSLRKPNPKLADSIAISLIADQNNSVEDSLLNKNVISFLNQKYDLLSTKDKAFQIAYTKPQLMDNFPSNQGFSKKLVNAVIGNEEVSKRILLEGGEPRWEVYRKAITEQYGDVDVDEIILAQKIKYYKSKLNWELYSNFKTEYLIKYPYDPKKTFAIFLGLNSPAWEIFEKSDNVTALENALMWANISIILMPNKIDHFQFLDTKANLLYKLQQTERAIQIEKLALETVLELNKQKDFSSYITDYKNNLNKMTEGKPTW